MRFLTCSSLPFHLYAISTRTFASPSASSIKPNLALLSRLRKEIEGVSMQRVKEALLYTKNDYEESKLYLNRLLAADAMKRESAGKPVTGEGLIAIAERPGVGAVMLEISCETDFVARTPVFKSLASRLAQTALFLRRPESHDIAPVESLVPQDLLSLPLLPSLASSSSELETMEEALRKVSGQVGETVRLRRAVLVTPPSSAWQVSSAVHGQTQTSQHEALKMTTQSGQLGALVLWRPEDPKKSGLGVQLAQHVIGMNPLSSEELSGQTFLFDGSQTVGQVLKSFHQTQEHASERDGVEMVRFERGEGIEKKETNFAEEVLKQAKAHE